MDISTNNFRKNKIDPQLYPIKASAALTKFKRKYATFQSSMKLTLIIGQCFALNPVLGICEFDTSKLRFTYRSWRFTYTMLSIVAQCTLVLIFLVKSFQNTESSLSTNSSLVFHATNSLSTILFLRVAMKWPRLCRYVSKTEATNTNTDNTLVKKCNVSCILILFLALVEHLLSDLSGIVEAVACKPNGNMFEVFIKRTYPLAFHFLPYNNYLGFIIQLINVQCTFNWNFADVFIICISLYLTSRLEQVNRRIAAARGKKVTSAFWRTVREDYGRATYLVRRVDDVIGGIIFISFANNLFFICLQLLHILEDGIRDNSSCRHGNDDSIRPLKGYETAVYFVYSFGFLVMRSLAVSMIGSKVHAASREPAYVLYEVTTEDYCVEVQRFLDQVHGDSVALSGLQFFDVKRGLVLTIAGTIVTYELVLIQFAGVTPTSAPLSASTVESVFNNSKNYYILD